MPQSLSAVYVHLVFSTKDHRPLLRDRELRAKLHAYLGGIAGQLECPPIIVDGVEDHVHLLLRLGRTVSQADLVKELKRVSTLWIKAQNLENADFAWQNGYGALSVSQSNCETVSAYIANQEHHHQRISFHDEVRRLFTKHKLEWDERYVWD